MARRDLSLWLLQQGRVDEGEALLVEARTVLEGLGAHAWLANVPGGSRAQVPASSVT